MVDLISKKKRSANMRAIRSEGTKPELVVRKMLSRLKVRYRLSGDNLPGRPDIVFASKKKVLFVHGCFWHVHRKLTCTRAHAPRSNLYYWRNKLDRNVKRDRSNIRKLRHLGWQSGVVWECELIERDALESRLKRFLGK